MLKKISIREALKLIDSINPAIAREFSVLQESSLELIKLSYMYGESIVKRGQFQLPSSCHESSIAKLDIDYCSIPLALVIHHSCEVSLTNSQRSLPISIIKPGHFFGVFETLSWLTGESKRSLWEVTAGSTSAFMLPSISDAIAHQRLQVEYSFSKDPPNEFIEHFLTFSQLNAKSASPWKCEIFLFPKEFLTHLSIQESFFRFIFDIGWKQSQRIRDQATLDCLNEIFNRIMDKRRTTIPPTLIERIKHLMMLANHNLPGFAPAMDESLLPLSTIQKAYREFIN